MQAASNNRPARQSLEDHLVPGRECGNCVACCKILKISQPELKKDADVLCPHSTGSGCGIHRTRPAICRIWFCLWRRIDALPDETRPDRLGVVFSLEQHGSPRVLFENLYIVGRAIDGPDAFETPQVAAILEMFAQEGSLPVFLSWDGTKKLVYPEPMLANAIVHPGTNESLVPAAAAWRAQYGFG